MSWTHYPRLLAIRPSADAYTHSYSSPDSRALELPTSGKCSFFALSARGGGLSGNTNTGQQLYWVSLMSNGLNPSVLMQTRGCLGSAAFFLCNASKCFHAEPSDVCTITRFPFASSLVLLPILCHVTCLAVSSTMKRRWSLGTIGRYRRTLTGILVYLFSPIPLSTTTYLEEL